MAFAAGRALDATFVRELERDREEYAMPPRLHELAERFARRTLALLFPHFAAEVGGRAGDVAEELGLLEKELADVLRLPETHCSSPDAVLERFLRALPSIREALLLDAQAICDGDPAAQSVDEVILAYPGFYATAVYRLAHQLRDPVAFRSESHPSDGTRRLRLPHRSPRPWRARRPRAVTA
jgi:serine O-acetyltransferase